MFGRDLEEWRERKAAESEARRQVLCKPGPARGVYAPVSEAVNAAPKGPPAKPGKGKPTKDEAEWLDGLIRHGCICCRMLGHGYVYPEIHHILRGSVRVGHKFTLPLCYSHHRGGAVFSSRHPWRTRFQELYGDEWALLASLQAVLKVQPDGSYAE